MLAALLAAFVTGAAGQTGWGAATKGYTAKSAGLHVTETPAELRLELAADVLFDFDKAEILPKAEPALEEAAKLIRERARGTVRVEGHTDAKGAADYNQALSERRADAVKSWLVEREGVRGITFLSRGFGATKPVAPNAKSDGSDDPDGRQKNRRVEIVIAKRS
jgi:outer membrane protein OmpA-like peptidoglycan-associated protein